MILGLLFHLFESFNNFFGIVVTLEMLSQDFEKFFFDKNLGFVFQFWRGLLFCRAC